jgi:GntR family transcriptional regulator
VGTFITRTLAGPSLVSHVDLREDLVAWLRKAEAAGLAREDITALIDTTMRTVLDGPARQDT